MKNLAFQSVLRGKTNFLYQFSLPHFHIFLLVYKGECTIERGKRTDTSDRDICLIKGSAASMDATPAHRAPTVARNLAWVTSSTGCGVGRGRLSSWCPGVPASSLANWWTATADTCGGWPRWDDYTTSSHYLTNKFLFKILGEFTFGTWEWKGWFLTQILLWPKIFNSEIRLYDPTHTHYVLCFRTRDHRGGRRSWPFWGH